MSEPRIEKKGLTALIKLCALFDGLSGEFGVLSGSPKYPDDGTPVAKVAGIINAKYGTFSRVIDKLGQDWEKIFTKACKDVVERGQDPKKVFTKIVTKAASDLKAQIIGEGHVDTGKLAKTIRWKVKDKHGKAVSGKAM